MMGSTERLISIMKKSLIFIIAISIAAVVCFMPIASVYCDGDYERGTLIVQGFNLMEFSAWGIVPLLADVLIPVIIFSKQSRGTKETELIILFIANAVSYVHSFNAAKVWLREIGDSMLSFHYGMVLFPLGFVAILLIIKLCFSLNEIIDSHFVKELQDVQEMIGFENENDKHFLDDVN